MTTYIKQIFIAVLSISFCACRADAPKDLPKDQLKETAQNDATKAQESQPLSTDEHDEEPPPPPPDGRPVTVYREGKTEAMTEPQAKEAGLTVVDLSNYWVPYIFSERDSDNEEKKPNEFRTVFRKLANDWYYESRTTAAAREVVEKHRRRTQSARIFALKQEGLTDEQIRERLGMPSAETTDTSADDSEKDTTSSGQLDAEGFGGGLGEEDNFLEVYGIPPSLSVLRKRALDEISRPCLQEVDFEAIRSFDGFASYRSNPAAEKESREGRRIARRVRDEMEKLGVSTIEALVAHPKNKISKGAVAQAQKFEALSAAQKLLACEGLYPKGQEKSYWAGGIDWKTQQALLAFEHKNRIFGWGFFGKDTLIALGKTPEERLFDAFVRVLQERIVDSAAIIEDGSVIGPEGKTPTYKDEAGVEQPVRNLVAEFTAAAMRHMDLQSPEKVIEFLKQHDDKSLDSLFIAIPVPEFPPYYSGNMSLKAVIDRGDIWYDPPFDSEGRSRSFPRKQMPMTTLYAVWNNQEIPLVSMNTTVGGWRTELASDGYEYYKYKNSDVGERVWKDIVAGPVWLPPDTTPSKDLIKEVRYQGRSVKVPNYNEFGPWYASAYGLVAGFHVRPVAKKNGEFVYHDNGIRSHGSVDYNSILRRHSHGCHRLYNHLAIRLFNYVLRHTPFVRVGQIPAGYSKKVVINNGEEEETYIIDLKSKGYKYELVTPVPVHVLTGHIRGKQRTPIEQYIPKPDVDYGTDAMFLPLDYKRKSEEQLSQDTDTTAIQPTSDNPVPADPKSAVSLQNKPPSLPALE